MEPMFIEQLYTTCLSEAAYYIESNNEAIVIDPLRDIEVYINLAAERKATIKYIFETHLHADFVSGHLDLSKATGAPIVYGPGTETAFPIHLAKDGEIFMVGNISLEALHTPGHSVESTCYLLRDENNKQVAVFTGDTLLINEVGRPDLSSGNLSKEELAFLLFDSLQRKIIPLDDDVIVYPAHGPGSRCGKHLGPGKSSTIKEQKQDNYALQPQDREHFITAVTEGLEEAPQYFPINAKINKEGYPSMDDLLERGLRALTVARFKELMNTDAVVLDSREPAVFTQGFVPGSISIGLNGRFAEWAGNLLPFGKPILLVTDPGQEKETLVRLARVGIDKVAGYLSGGYQGWLDAGEQQDLIIDVEPDELLMDIPYDDNLVVLDVRRETEFADGHLKDAVNIPLNDLVDPGSMANLEENQNIYVHCGGGYRSVIASSLLKREGFHNIRNVTGGWDKIKEQENIEVVKDASLLN
jgi:glyoxylase-like metal-dependent hydrolase (beta-lactamase superfamily II)/rhodanese-related sulfurtransferase